jgi:hypothetical protein
VIQIFQERFLGRPEIVVRTQSGYLETSWETRPDSTAEESRRIRVHEKLQVLQFRIAGAVESRHCHGWFRTRIPFAVMTRCQYG